MPPRAARRIAIAGTRPTGPPDVLTACESFACEVAPPGAWELQPQSAKLWRRIGRRIVSKGPRRNKIGNRRGPDKWLDDAKLERRAEAHRPVGALARPVERLGVVEPQDYEPQQVHANRAAPAVHRGADVGEGLPRAAVPLHGAVFVPGETDVVEEGALDRREAERQEAEHEAAGEREAQLDVADGDAGADQLIELGAAAEGLGADGGDALVLAERAAGVAADELGRAQVHRGQIGVAADAPEELAAHGNGERPEEEVAPPVGEPHRELPRPEGGQRLQPPAPAGEGTHPAG